MRLPNIKLLRQIMKFNKRWWLTAAIRITRPGCQKNLATSLAVVEVKMLSVFYVGRPNCVLI